MSDTAVDLLPISALQHIANCPRQFALIHITDLGGEPFYRRGPGVARAGGRRRGRDAW